MPFFLVGRSRDDASLSLLSAEVFDTRDLAARAVQSIAASGSIDVDAVDVFIADLGASAPVVLVGLPVSAPPVDEAAAGVWETPEVLDEPQIPTEVPAESLVETEADLNDLAAEVESLSAEEALTAALERATSSMAAEGIVPPESVGFAVLTEDASKPPVPILGDDEPLADVTVAEPTVEQGDTVEAVAVDDVALEAVPILVTDEVQPTEEPVGSPDELSAVIASLSSLDEADVAEAPGLTDDAVAEESVPDTDDAVWPWMNVGAVEETPAADEPDTPSEPASIAMEEPVAPVDAGSAEESVPEESTVAEEFVASDEPSVRPDDDSLIAASSPLVDEEFSPKPVIMGDYADSPGVPEAPTTAYEPSGELSLADYTCADCIYSNTCPKVNESVPEECGSFQWKAV